jgi:sugar transferase (PEP-CTERM system associated)
MSMGLYGPRLGVRFSDTVARAGIAIGLAAVADAVVYYFWPAVEMGRGAQALALGLSLIAVLVTRVIFYRFIQRRRFRSTVLVYGQGRTAADVAQAALDSSHRSYQIAGFVPVLGEVAEDICKPLVGQRGESLLNVARELGIDEIVVAVDNCRNRFPMQDLLDCRLAGVKVTEVVSFTERESGKIDLAALRPSWLIYGTGFRQRTLDRMFKRCFDVGASLLLLTVALPLMLIGMLAILIESRGRFGVFLRQERVGQHGRPFSMLKLRSMVPNAESNGQALWSLPGDRRVTRVGAVLRRFRIDELPQIINILRGEMSFVGPRPERPEFVRDLSRDIPYYDERHSV